MDFPQDVPLSEDVKQLLRSLLQKLPADRPILSQIFSFPWVQKMTEQFHIDMKKYMELSERFVLKSNGLEKSQINLNFQLKKDEVTFPPKKIKYFYLISPKTKILPRKMKIPAF